MTSSRTRTALLRAATVLGVVAALLLVAEMALRAVRHHVIAKNSQPLPGPGDKIILSLGESTTFGLHTPPRDNYSALLQRQLNDQHPGSKLHVANLGWPAAISTDIAACGTEAIEVYEPVMVLACLGHNDFAYQMNYLARGLEVPADQRSIPFQFDDGARYRAPQGLLLLRVVRRVFGVSDPWRRHCDRQNNPRPAYQGHDDPTPADWGQLRAEIEGNLQDNLRSLSNLSRAREIPLVLIGYLRSPANRIVAQFAKENGIAFVDNAIAGDRTPYVVDHAPSGRADGFHPNERGHELMARNILRTIDDHRLLALERVIQSR